MLIDDPGIKVNKNLKLFVALTSEIHLTPRTRINFQNNNFRSVNFLIVGGSAFL